MTWVLQQECTLAINGNGHKLGSCRRRVLQRNKHQMRTIYIVLYFGHFCDFCLFLPASVRFFFFSSLMLPTCIFTRTRVSNLNLSREWRVKCNRWWKKRRVRDQDNITIAVQISRKGSKQALLNFTSGSRSLSGVPRSTALFFPKNAIQKKLTLLRIGTMKVKILSRVVI